MHIIKFFLTRPYQVTPKCHVSLPHSTSSTTLGLARLSLFTSLMGENASNSWSGWAFFYHICWPFQSFFREVFVITICFIFSIKVFVFFLLICKKNDIFWALILCKLNELQLSYTASFLLFLLSYILIQETLIIIYSNISIIFPIFWGSLYLKGIIYIF